MSNITKAYKQLVGKKRSEISEKQFFTGIFQRKMEELVAGTLKRYGSVKVHLKFPLKKTEMIGCTDCNQTITVCPNNPYTENLDLKGKASFTEGVLIHELAHMLYTNHKHENTYANRIINDLVFLEDGSGEQVNEFLQNNPGSARYVASLFHRVCNIMEDGHIEQRIMQYLKGVAKHLRYVRRITYAQMQESGSTGNEMADFCNILLEYAKFGTVHTVGNRADDLLEMVKDDVDRALGCNYSYDRVDIYAEIFDKILTSLIKDEENGSDKEDQQYGTPSSQGSSSDQEQSEDEQSSSGSSGEDEGNLNEDGDSSEEEQGNSKNKKSDPTSEEDDVSSDDERGEDEQSGSGSDDESSSDDEQGEDEQSGSGSDDESSSDDERGEDEQSGSGFDENSGENEEEDEGEGENNSSSLEKMLQEAAEDGENDSQDSSSDSTPLSEGSSSSSGNGSGDPSTSSSPTSRQEKQGEDAEDDNEASEKEMEKLLSELAEQLANEETEAQIGKMGNTLKSNMDFGNYHRNTTCTISRSNPVPLSQEVQDTASALRRMISEYKKEIEKKKKGYKLNGLYSGRRLSQPYRADLKAMSSRIAPSDLVDMEVTLLIDQSGSMSDGYGEWTEGRIKYARLTALIVYMFCQELGIPCHVWGHCAYKNHVELELLATPDSTDNKDLNRICGLRAKNMCNRDGYALRYCAEELSKSRAQKKLLMIISDGAPNDVGYGYYKACPEQSNAKKDINEVLQEYHRKGVSFVAAGIGSDTDEIRGLYSTGLSPKVAAHFLEVGNLETMPKLFIKILKKEIDG